MLTTISLGKDGKVKLGEVTLTFLGCQGRKARLGFVAPKEVTIKLGDKDVRGSDDAAADGEQPAQ